MNLTLTNSPSRGRIQYVTNNYFSIPAVYKKEYSRIYLQVVTSEEFVETMKDGRIKGHNILWVNNRDSGALLKPGNRLACSFRTPLDMYDTEPTVIVTGHWEEHASTNS